MVTMRLMNRQLTSIHSVLELLLSHSIVHPNLRHIFTTMARSRSLRVCFLTYLFPVMIFLLLLFCHVCLKRLSMQLILPHSETQFTPDIAN